MITNNQFKAGEILIYKDKHRDNAIFFVLENEALGKLNKMFAIIDKKSELRLFAGYNSIWDYYLIKRF